jgi:hypothetical protein
MPRKKTHVEFIQEVYELVGGEYIVLGEYINARTKVLLKHCLCDHEWKATPSDFVNNNSRCPECSKKIIASKISLTQEKFINRVIEIRGDVYEFIGQYVNNRTPIKTKHKTCGYIWDANPKHMLTRSEKGKVYCPHCTGNIKLNTELFKQRVFDLVGEEYFVLGEYEHGKTKIKMKHNLCNHEYHVTPNCFLSDVRCPKCYGKTKRTTDEFKEIVYISEGNEYTLIGEYFNSSTPVKMKHTKCNCEFMIIPDKFTQRNQRCPYCFRPSNGESVVLKYLENNKVNFIIQYKFPDCKNINPLPFDFAIFDKQNNLIYLIEYDGQQHFEPRDFAGKGEEWALEQFKSTKLHDNIKNTYCRDNNIPLYRIPYWKFDEIESIINKLINNAVEVDEKFIVI